MIEPIPGTAVFWISFSAVILFLIPVIYFFILRRKFTIKSAPLLCGILGFFVFVKILETIPHMFCIVLDNPVSRFINGNAFVYMLYGALMAGIFEECGRYVIFKFLLKKEKSPSTAIAYGLGHGGFEVYIISFAVAANNLTIALVVNLLDSAAAMKLLGITEANQSTLDSVVTALSTYGAGLAGVTILERVLVVAIHITLSVIVFFAVQSGQLRYLFLAIAGHAILDAPAALYQKGIAPLWFTEVWLAVCLIVLLIFAKNLYQKMDKLITA